MGSELIAQLMAARAFEPSPNFRNLAVYHCPFEELIPDCSVETTLLRVVETDGRSPLIGVSGSGKTSVTAYVLNTLASDAALIRVPVRDLGRHEAVNPQIFQRHVLDSVGRVAQQAERLDKKRKRELKRVLADRVVVHEGQRSVQFAIPKWLLAGGELAVEIQRSASDTESTSSTGDIRDALNNVLAAMRRAALAPVLVIDDTDSWLNVDDKATRSALVVEFFANVLRPLAEFPCAVVVATHREYLELPGVRQALAFAPDRIEVPELTRQDSLERILERRLVANGILEPLSEVFDQASLASLWHCYVATSGHSIRRVLDVAHNALNDACDRGSDAVGAASVVRARQHVFGP